MAKQQRRFGSRKEVAEALGITRQRLEKLIKEGRIPETANGIDIAEAKRLRQTQTDPARRAGYEMARQRKLHPTPDAKPRPAILSTARASTGDGLQMFDFNAARAKRETHNASMAELKYQVESGRLMSRDEVAAKEFAVARRIRDTILGWPARLAGFLPPDAIQIISTECESLIRDLDRDVASIAERGDVTKGT